MAIILQTRVTPARPNAHPLKQEEDDGAEKRHRERELQLIGSLFHGVAR
jgi:hypothetical protein